MVKNVLSIFMLLLLRLSVLAQVQIDRPIDLNSLTPGNARIMGIKEVSDAKDAVSAEVLQKGGLIYKESAGGPNAYTLAISPAVTPVEGTVFHFKANIGNAAGGVTLNGIPVKKDVGTDLAAGDIQTGQLVTVAHDGTRFQLISRTTDANSGGTVTNVSVTTTNGVSGTVANSTTTPAISLTLGAITPSSVAASGTVTGSNLSGTHTGTSSGTNTGDQTLSGLGGVPTSRTIGTTAPLAGGGDLSADRTLSISQANGTTNGYLSSTDWTTFNSKESALTFSNGLTRTSNTVTLGGSLTGATTISQAANTLAFTSTATNGFSVDGTTFSVDAANNRVGIGTALPEQALHINGNIKKDFTASSGGTSGWFIVNNDGAGNWHEYINTSGSTTPTRLSEGSAFQRVYSPNTVASLSNIMYEQYSAPGAAAAAITWLTYLQVDAVNNRIGLLPSGGNVGIGLAAPAHRLTIINNGQSNAAIGARNAGANAFEWGHGNTAGYGSTIGHQAGNGLPFIAFSAEAGTNNNTYLTRGNVGTVIRGDIAGGLTINKVPLAAADNQDLTTLVTVLANGNVGINTGSSAPIEKLDIGLNSSIFMEGNSNAWGYKLNVNDYGSGDVPLRFIRRNSGTDAEMMRLSQAGYLGIGSTNPDRPLTILNTSEWNIASRSTNTTNTNRNHVLLQRANGTSAVTTNFMLGGIAIGGYDGANYSYGWDGGAEITAFANQPWTSTARGTYLTFGTTADGAAGISERMRIASNGTVNVDNLKGSGNVPVFADNSGNLFKGSISSQWRLVFKEDFETGSTGWVGHTATNGITAGTFGRTQLNATTMSGTNWILTNYFATTPPTINGTANIVLKKEIDLTGIPHSEVLVKLTYFFIDSWDTEGGWFGVSSANNVIPDLLWGDIWDFDNYSAFTNTSGGTFAGGARNLIGLNFSDRQGNAEGQFKNSSDKFWLMVGSRLDGAPAGDESYGIDNVEIYVR